MNNALIVFKNIIIKDHMAYCNICSVSDAKGLSCIIYPKMSSISAAYVHPLHTDYAPHFFSVQTADPLLTHDWPLMTFGELSIQLVRS